MIFFIFYLLSLTSFFTSMFALPLVIRDYITALSQQDVSHFDPYTYFASSGYCKPANTKAWSCRACKMITGFEPHASGGNGATTQYWYVGYWPAEKSIVVVYQGTDPSKVIPIFTDIHVVFTAPDPALFKGVPAGAKIHSGFNLAFKQSQQDVLLAVKQLIASKKTTKITVVGHSLGGALASLSAVSMRSILGKSYQFKVVAYGMPRIGNQEWANYVDSRVPDLTHINNKRDPIPIVPGTNFKYVGTHGEIHIGDNGVWNKCSGSDNRDSRCAMGSVPSLARGRIPDHSGPYNGITMGMC